MEQTNVIQLGRPAFHDALTDVIRNGARELLRQAIEAEVADWLESHRELRTAEGKRAIVRNGYQPERGIQTGIGSVAVKIPKTRDRTGSGLHFNSSLVPPYLRRSKSVEELLPWMYLKGISTGDFQETLGSILGADAPGLSPGVISRLKSDWIADYDDWNKRSLKGKHFVYIWCDAVYFGIRGENDKSCVLVIIGATATGHKELVALSDGLRESKESWHSLLSDLKKRGLTVDPSVAVADGALGFWAALPEVFPSTKEQRCWKHKSSNVLDKLPSSLQAKAKKDLQDIWMAETKLEAEMAFDGFIKLYQLKYPKATECLAKDRDSLLAFYSFPAEHWPHLRTSNPVESVFSTVRHRANKTKGCVSRSTLLGLVLQLVLSAQKRWQRLRGFEQVAKIIAGVQFVDGIEDLTPQKITA